MRGRASRPTALVALALAAAALLVALPGLARGQSASHDLFHRYYQFWYNQIGNHCCRNEHCRPTEARWNAEAGQWEALVLGRWVLIQPSQIVRDDYGLDPFPSVCHNDSGHVYCFDPPGAQG